jgi:hypothetical protein
VNTRLVAIEFQLDLLLLSADSSSLIPPKSIAIDRDSSLLLHALDHSSQSSQLLLLEPFLYAEPDHGRVQISPCHARSPGVGPTRCRWPGACDDIQSSETGTRLSKPSFHSHRFATGWLYT